jgi:hypothetical protein
MMLHDEVHSESGRETAPRVQDLLRYKRSGYVGNYAKLDPRISRQREEEKEEQVKRSARRGVTSTAASLNHQP